MVEIFFTHDSIEGALKTRDLLHQCLKGRDAYVNNEIILSDGDPDCVSGDQTRTCKLEDGTEVKCNHCITLLISGKNENTHNQVIYVSKDVYPFISLFIQLLVSIVYGINN